MEVSGKNLNPELSWGSHFFQDLVEAKIKYFALTLQQKTDFLNQKLLTATNNLSNNILPEIKKQKNVIYLLSLKQPATIIADVKQHKFLGYINK